MGGKSGGDPKMKVTRYYLSLHAGICHGPVDAIKALWVGEKRAWRGNITENGTLGVRKENLFGGEKKEGGVSGQIDVMLGGPDQVPPSTLVERLKRPRADVPGFRGITSLLFRGRGTTNSDFDPTGLFGMARLFLFLVKYRGFYWGTQPYLKPVWVTVQRIPARALAPETAPIPRGGSSQPLSLYLALDFSGSMDTLTGNGETRFANMKTAVYGLLDYLEARVAAGEIPRVDICLSGYGTDPSTRFTIIRRSVSASGIAELKSWFPTVSPGYYTYFPAGVVDAGGFFSGGSSEARRVLFFLTDGEPTAQTSGETPAQIADAARSEIDQIAGVESYAANIDLTDTQYTEVLANTPGGVPVVSGGDPSALTRVIVDSVFTVFDANPAHVVHECLTDTDWGMGADPESVDTASFQAASQTLYDEGFGVFLQWQAQSSIEDFINEVLDHVRGAIYPDPRTGRITLALLRNDLDGPNLKTITPDNARLNNFSRKGWGETTNEIVVTWTRPETEQEETVVAQDLANIVTQGGIVSSSKNYHGIRTRELAARVAERDLREESAPLSSCEAEVNREFWDITPFDGVKVTWPEFGLDGLVMRVMKVDYGDSQNATIKLSLVEDVFSLASAAYVEPAGGEWVDPAEPPVPVDQVRLMPPPAYVVSQNGIDPGDVIDPSTAAVPLAVNPTGDESARYDVLREVATPSGGTTFQDSGGTRDFPARGTLAAALPQAVTSAGVLLDDLAGPAPAVDDLLLLGDDALANDALELVLVSAVDDETGALTLLRGVLDTAPRDWVAGTTVQVTPLTMWRPLPVELTATQSVTLKFLTRTAYGMLEEYEAPEFTGTATQRPALPTRPGNLRAFGDLFPDPSYYPDYPVTVTWSHRNRLLEDAAMLAWDATDLPVEEGVEYRVLVEAIQEDGTVDGTVDDVTQPGTSYDLTVAAVGATYAGSPFMRVSVFALRGGLQSWQAGSVRFRGPFREPENLRSLYLDDQPVRVSNYSVGG